MSPKTLAYRKRRMLKLWGDKEFMRRLSYGVIDD